MLESGQNWELFGYDMRNVGRQLSAAWRDLLFGYDSPVRRRLDETVRLITPEGNRCYHAGTPTADTDTDCEAILLPEDLVLSRTLRLPLAVEADLEDVLALEVSANSPFPADDTSFGWQVLYRDTEQLTVRIDIVSMASAMEYMARTYDRHDSHAQEVWSRDGETLVVLRGFGEARREGRYRRRLVRTGSALGVAALLLLGVIAASAAFKSAELSRMQTLAASVREEAADASRMRSALAEANATIASVNEMLAGRPSPHRELARLTALLGDDVSIERFSMVGREMTLRGLAADASEVMKQLAAVPDYVQVRAPGAITRMPGTNLESFQLDVVLAGGPES